MQTNQFAEAISSIPGIVDKYLDHRMNEVMKKIIKEQVKEQVKVQVSKILPKIKKTVNEQLKAEVLTRSSNSSKTSLVVATDLSELELKKILIDTIESNKSFHRSDEQKNLYKALVDAYECDRLILDTYGDTVTLKRCRDDKDKDEEPSAGSNWRNLAKKADSRTSFNELMDTPIDFLAFMMNRLKVDTLTYELLVGPTYELMKGSCKRLVELELFLEESQVLVIYDKHALWGISHWGCKRQHFYRFAVNRESAQDVYSKRRIIAVTELQIVEWHNYKHLDWIIVQKLTNLTVDEHFAFNVSLRMFTRSIIIQRRVEDLQLGVESYPQKLNLTKPDTYRSNLKRKKAYTAYSNPRGFIYQNKDKQNKLMRIDELHKFSDDTLNDVQTTLDDRLKGIQMQYLP
nr:hypothetical protein [Tanacetum cinerariifolium]